MLTTDGKGIPTASEIFHYYFDETTGSHNININSIYSWIHFSKYASLPRYTVLFDQNLDVSDYSLFLIVTSVSTASVRLRYWKNGETIYTPTPGSTVVGNTHYLLWVVNAAGANANYLKRDK